MSVAGRESLTRAGTRIRPLTNSKGIDWVGIVCVASAAVATALPTAHAARHVRIASHGHFADGEPAISPSLREGPALVTWNARAPLLNAHLDAPRASKRATRLCRRFFGLERFGSFFGFHDLVQGHPSRKFWQVGLRGFVALSRRQPVPLVGLDEIALDGECVLVGGTERVLTRGQPVFCRAAKPLERFLGLFGD